MQGAGGADTKHLDFELTLYVPIENSRAKRTLFWTLDA